MSATEWRELAAGDGAESFGSCEPRTVVRNLAISDANSA